MDHESALRWATFLVGAAGMVYAMRRESAGATAAQRMAAATVPAALMLVALFGPRVLSLKAGADGFEIALSDVKEAALDAIEKNPTIAEDITGKKGSAAVDEAKSKIARASSDQELEAIISHRKGRGEILFFPKSRNGRTGVSPVRVPLKAPDGSRRRTPR